MTKYILHGGASKYNTENNNKFFKEITHNLSNLAKILIVCHMMENKNWNDVFENDQIRFNYINPNKNFKFVLADKDKAIFIEQVKNADAIFMHGGNTHILKKYLDNIPNIEKIWENKVVVGTSAGALVLGKYFYENDDDTYNMGLGILPFKLFCHYSDEKLDKLGKLKSFQEDYEVKTIAEQNFIVVDK